MGLFGGAAGFDVEDEGAVYAQAAVGVFGGQFYACERAANFSVLNQVGYGFADDIDGDGEADACAAAGRAVDGGIDADESA